MHYRGRVLGRQRRQHLLHRIDIGHCMDDPEARVENVEKETCLVGTYVKEILIISSVDAKAFPLSDMLQNVSRFAVAQAVAIGRMRFDDVGLLKYFCRTFAVIRQLSVRSTHSM